MDQTKEIMKTTNTVIKTKFIDWYYQWVWITWIPKSISQKIKLSTLLTEQLKEANKLIYNSKNIKFVTNKSWYIS